MPLGSITVFPIMCICIGHGLVGRYHWGRAPPVEIRFLFFLVGCEIPPCGRCSALRSGRLDAVG